MTEYTVYGGEYTNMSFTEVKKGKEVSFGPFTLHQDALDCWKANMWLNVDNALYRLQIKND